MPMREYLCHDCRRIYTFLMATTGDARRPRCPRCAGVDLERQMSTFARTQTRKEPLAATPRRPGDPQVAGIEMSHRDRDGNAVEHDDGIYPIRDHCVEGDPAPTDDPDLRPTRKEVSPAMGGEGPRPPGMVILVTHKRDER